MAGFGHHVGVEGSDDLVPVSDMSRYGRVWLVSMPDGKAVVGNDSVTCHGVGLPYPRPISAVFVHHDRVWLQVGLRRWDVDTISDVRQISETSGKAIYELVLSAGEREFVEIRFPPSVRTMRTIDPTHDEIDSWSEDIMKVLPYTASDGWKADPREDITSWKARVLPLWRSGISARP